MGEKTGASAGDVFCILFSFLFVYLQYFPGLWIFVSSMLKFSRECISGSFE